MPCNLYQNHTVNYLNTQKYWTTDYTEYSLQWSFTNPIVKADNHCITNTVSWMNNSSPTKLHQLSRLPISTYTSNNLYYASIPSLRSISLQCLWKPWIQWASICFYNVSCFVFRLAPNIMLLLPVIFYAVTKTLSYLDI